MRREQPGAGVRQLLLASVLRRLRQRQVVFAEQAEDLAVGRAVEPAAQLNGGDLALRIGPQSGELGRVESEGHDAFPSGGRRCPGPYAGARRRATSSRMIKNVGLKRFSVIT